MVDTNFLAGQASVWVQPNGPNTKPEFLGCHGFGDITEPQGDVTLLYCPDPGASGKFRVKNSFQGAPGAVTTTVTTDIRKVADYLETVKCGVPIFIHKVSCGRRDDFTNFDRSFILRNAKVTQRTLSNLAARNPGDNDESLQAFDLSAQEVLRVFNLYANRVSLVETQTANNIFVAGEDRCETDCGQQQNHGDIIVIGTNAGAGAKANVLITTTAGVPVAAANDPFANDEHIFGVAVVKVGRDTNRVIVARGSTDAGNPMEIAYSDDFGATAWNAVNIGSTNGEFCPNGHALFVIDMRNMWLGTNLGNIYYSSDGGASWTLQTTAALASDVVAISFIDENYGYAALDTGVVYKTVDGGLTWGAVSGATGTAGTATDIDVTGRFTAYMSATDGMFFTSNGGTSWTKRNAYAIAAVSFKNELEGLAVGSAASGLIYQTINGGYTWSALTLLANSGWKDVAWVHSQLAYAAGAPQGGTAMYANMVPVP